MKKLVLLFAFFTFVGANAFSQTVDEDLLIRLMEAAGFEKSNDEYKTYVAEDGEDSFWKTFYGSNEYIVVAFPEEEGVYDLDLFLYDDNDKEIAKGTSDGSVEILTYSDSDQQDLKVTVKNYESYSSSTKYKIRILVFWK